MMGKPFSAIICFIMQFTIILWIPAMWWAILVINNYNTEQSFIKALNTKK